MKVDPRAALFALILGAGLTITLVALALASPGEGFLLLLFPSLFLWAVIPFLLLWLLRKGRGGEGR